ncbi:chymotrypsinogen A-like [Haliotis cracherodii]|uniref:chymotrypsinogen A-like n=1 Tax=Haliotis cracherodii TaxID=6455 RepID=UPI0039EBA127
MTPRIDLYFCLTALALFAVSFISSVEGCWRTKLCNYDCRQRNYRSKDYPLDCSRYYFCVNGVKWRNMRCPTGRVFSGITRTCVHPNDVSNDCPSSYTNRYPVRTQRPKYVRTTKRPVPVYQSCGIKSSPNIMGGSEAHDGEWSWQVSLQSRSRTSGSSSHFCGGVLINSRWVATASHCVIRRFSGMIKVVIGAHNLRKPSRYQVKIGVQSIHMHPKYQNMGSYPNDIALIKLADPVDLRSGFIREVCLPKPYEVLADESAYSRESGCWVTGWGMTSKARYSDVLQEVRIGLVNNTYCAKLWRGYVNNNHICVGMGDKGACRGDSGGPMMCSKNGRYYLVGITSWGEESCTEYGYPNIFTRVSNYMKWITDTMKANP